MVNSEDKVIQEWDGLAEVKIGLSMLYCLGKSFQYMIKQLGWVDVEYVEVLDEALHTLNKRRIKILREKAEEYGLKLSVHAPFVDINIASPNRHFRRIIMKRMKRSMGFAEALGAAVWVFHPGLKTGVSHIYPGLDWEINILSVKELLEESEGKNLRIAIENTPKPVPFILRTVEDFKRFYEEIGEVDLGLTLDIGHANLYGEIYDFIEAFKGRIIHVHASDNDGRSDLHLGIGEGCIDWTGTINRIREAGYDGTIIIESERKVTDSIDVLRRLSG